MKPSVSGKIIVIIYLIMLTVSGIVPAAHAATFYVDNGAIEPDAAWDGVDGHTYSSPNGTGIGYSTIKAAVAAMSAGTTIYMRGGTYHETHIDLTSSRHGLDDAKNKLASYPGEWAIIDGQYADPSYFRPAVLWATGGGGFSNWIFERFEVTGGGDPVTLPSMGAGIALDSPKNVEFRSLYIHDNYMMTQGWGYAGGIMLASPANCIVEFCYFKGNGNPWYLVQNITSIERADNVVTVETSEPHNFHPGWYPRIRGVADTSFNRIAYSGIDTVPTPTTFTYQQTGPDATSSGGTAESTGYDRGTSNAQIGVTADYRYAQTVHLDTAMHGNIYRYNLFDGTSNIGQRGVTAFAHKGMQRLTGYELAETGAGGEIQNERREWLSDTSYAVNDVVYSGSVTFGPYYICTQTHTSDSDSQPTSGTDWQTFWTYCDNLPNDDSLREYGDKIHHNIIRNLSVGFRIDQDYCQVHNNIIWLSANINDPLLVFESKDGFNGGRRGSTRTCFYNNTAYADGGMGVGFSVASRDSKPTYDCSTDGNIAVWGYGLAQNNIIMNATHGYDSSFLFAEMSGNINCDAPNPLNPMDGNFLFHRNLFFDNEIYDGGKVIRFSNKEYTPDEIDATPASDKTWQLNSGALFLGVSGAEKYRTDGSFALDSSYTIADGGIGGTHPYLQNVIMPTYIGATDPENDEWVAGVLSLEAPETLKNISGRPAWVEGDYTEADFNTDRDVDGEDLASLALNPELLNIERFAIYFGR